MSKTLRNLCKIKIESIFQTTIRLMNKNSHLSPFSSSSVAEATIEEKEKTFEMLLRQSKFKECTVLLSILKQTISSINQNIFSHCCLLLYCYYYFLWNTGSFSMINEDIILKYLVNLQKTLLWTAQLWTKPFCNPLEP